jgi:hypothetical protein
MRTSFISLPRASAAALALVLSQTTPSRDARAEEPPAPPAQAAQAPETRVAQQTAQPTPATPAEAARARADEARTAMEETRKKRYQALRASAAELGVDLPETPPWESSMPGMPEPMHAMTAEERRAMWESRWQQRRKDAAAHGIDLPETPPWVEAEKRHQAMREQFERYRQTVEQMSKEQREAAQAVFGQANRHSHQHPALNTDGRDGWHSAQPCHVNPYAMPYPPAMPGYDVPGYQEGPPPPQKGTGN